MQWCEIENLIYISCSCTYMLKRRSAVWCNALNTLITHNVCHASSNRPASRTQERAWTVSTHYKEIVDLKHLIREYSDLFRFSIVPVDLADLISRLTLPSSWVSLPNLSCFPTFHYGVYHDPRYLWIFRFGNGCKVCHSKHLCYLPTPLYDPTFLVHVGNFHQFLWKCKSLACQSQHFSLEQKNTIFLHFI